MRLLVQVLVSSPDLAALTKCEQDKKTTAQSARPFLLDGFDADCDRGIGRRELYPSYFLANGIGGEYSVWNNGDFHQPRRDDNGETFLSVQTRHRNL